MCTAAKDILGLCRKKLPDWFHASSTVLLPLIDAKNAACVKLLQQDSASANRHFRQTQHAAEQAGRHAKETWIEDVATQAEQARPNDSARWDAIRKLQTLHRGCGPVQPSAVYLEDGTLTDGPDSVCSRWFRHFRGVLNVESVFDPDVLNSMEGRLPY